MIVSEFKEQIKDLNDNYDVVVDGSKSPLMNFKEKLNKLNDNDTLKSKDGLPFWYVVIHTEDHQVIVKTKKDINLSEKIEKVFNKAVNGEISELDAFLYLTDNGVTLEDFENAGVGDYAKRFMEEHGLL